MKVPVTLVAAGLLVVAGSATAVSLTKNAHPPTVSVGGVRPSAVGPVSITQSTSLVPVSGNSVSCNQSGLHADNSYWRAFPLSGFPALDSTFFLVDSVDIGVETALGAAGTQPIVVSLYKNTGAAFPGGSLTLVSTTNVTVADQSLTLLNVPITPVVSFTNATDTLVLEVFTPSGQAAGHSFFVGSNAGGESASSYISAAACGLTTPATPASIGFPGMQIVMRVNGQNQTTPVELQRVTIE